MGDGVNRINEEQEELAAESLALSIKKTAELLKTKKDIERMLFWCYFGKSGIEKVVGNVIRDRGLSQDDCKDRIEELVKNKLGLN
uniref:Uncharacterized protein n=1 Tax=uncultured bacterium contig00046 TaxID=1181532 RepID=A0A806JY35_9BACT|nr:hypothetical protein [uncultured bacterium contig00046]